jgi:hypothetical protein
MLISTMKSHRKSTWLLLMLFALGLTLISTGCSGGGSSATNSMSSSTPSANSAVQVKIGDGPADGVLAFELNISQIALTPSSGSAVTVLNTPTEIELTHLSGTLEPLVLSKVPSGTYTGAAVTVTTINVTYIPSTGASPVQKQFALNTTINVTFTPSLTVGSGASVVNFDVNLAQSLTFDASGNLTGIAPVITVTTAAPPASGDDSGEDDEHGRWDGAVGTVTTITPASGSTPASFVITAGMSGQTQTFEVNSSTQFSDGLSQFSDLKSTMLVKVNSVTQSDGTLLATQVAMLEASEGQDLAGIITATTGTPVTSMTLLVNDEAGAMSSSTVGSSVTVDVSNAVFKTPFGSMDDDSNVLTNLPIQPVFDSSHIGKGQNVEVDVNGPVSGTSAIANIVHLHKQSISGMVAAPAMGSTASFSLLLDANSAFAKLTGITSLDVYQVAHTDMKKQATVGSTVKVRGFLFFNNGQYVLVAGRVLQP